MPSGSVDSKIESKRRAAREVIDVLSEISVLLNSHLDRSTLSICVSLVENGVNPEALATVIRELRKEGAKVRGDNAESS